ncbi:MAG TPA: polyphenol oxidase family protein [Solirubrobacteraceae bacterium]
MSSSDAPAAPEGLSFELPGGGRALFTTRADGNLSSVGGLDHERGLQARERLRDRLGLSVLARGYQVHGTFIRCIREPADLPAHADTDAAQPPIEADGHATSIAGVGVMALGADCLPVALGGAGAVAMVHAGWRGLAAGVLEEGVLALRALGVEGEIAAIVGPGAGHCCYEVGPEVHAAFGGVGAAGAAGTTGTTGAGGAGAPADDSHVRTGGAAEACGTPIDLRAIVRSRLRAAGVLDVRDAHMCTICDERFYSHRREGADAGRNGGVAWLNPSP